MREATRTTTWACARTRSLKDRSLVKVESREALSGAWRKPRRNRPASVFLVGRHAASKFGHARRTHSLQHMLRFSREHHHANHHRLPKIYRSAHHARAAAAG